MLNIAGSLFSPSSSPERKHSGFLLLAKVVVTAPSQYIMDIFTINTVSLLVDHLKIDERYLHRSANKAMQALQSRAIREPSIVSCVIQGLVLGPSGLYNFDTISKTKNVAKLLRAADQSTSRDLVLAVRGAMEHPQEIDQKQADARRRAFADVLVSICTRALATINPENKTSTSVPEMVVDTLIGLAYSNRSFGQESMTFEPQPSTECRAYLRSRIRTCLDQSLQHLAVKFDLLRHTIHSVKAVQEQADGGHVIVELDERTKEIVGTAWKNVRKLFKTVSFPSLSPPFFILILVVGIAKQICTIRINIC